MYVILSTMGQEALTAVPNFDDTIRIVLESYPIEFGLLFGSQAQKKARSESDLDIAVFFSKKENVKERRRLRRMLLPQLSLATGIDNIDLIVLNDAPDPVLKVETLKGRPILVRNRPLYLNFREESIKQFLDTEHIRNECYFHLKKRYQDSGG